MRTLGLSRISAAFRLLNGIRVLFGQRSGRGTIRSQMRMWLRSPQVRPARYSSVLIGTERMEGRFNDRETR